MAKNSLVILAKNIKIDKKNVTRLDGTAMLSLLRSNSHLVYEGNNFSLIQDGTIELPTTYENCIKSNYIAFQNPRYADKVFFAWITKVTYLNDGTTEIEYEVDSWTTWYAHLDFKPCFTIREHVNNDTTGLHTVDENIDIGEIICEGLDVSKVMSDNVYAVIETTYEPTGTSGGNTHSGLKMYNRNIFGAELCLFPMGTATDILQMNLFLYRCAQDGKIENINNIFCIPRKYFY